MRRCLTKDPKRRLRDIGDVELLLEDSRRVTVTKRPWLPWAVAGLFFLALGAIAFRHFREMPPVAGAPVRFQIPVEVSVAQSGNLGLSPDGRQLAFLGIGDDGLTRLFIRAMDSLEVKPLLGSEVAAYGPPFFWSPDSRAIAFDAGGVLKKMNVAGGPADTLCTLTAGAIGGSWNSRGDILVGNLQGGILRVPENGGPATLATTLDAARKKSRTCSRRSCPTDVTLSTFASRGTSRKAEGSSSAASTRSPRNKAGGVCSRTHQA